MVELTIIPLVAIPEKSTRNGNPVYTVVTTTGQYWKTLPDSAVAFTVNNYKGKLTTITIENYRGEPRITGMELA